MMEYDDLKKDFDENHYSQSEVILRAYRYLTKYKDHVESINVNNAIVPPSGSDLFHPELWKDIHWNWFFNIEKNRGLM